MLAIGAAIPVVFIVLGVAVGLSFIAASSAVFLVFLALCAPLWIVKLRAGDAATPSSGCVVQVDTRGDDLDARLKSALAVVVREPSEVQKGVWVGSARPSWRTFGDRVAVVQNDGNQVAVLSWTPGLAVIDYGKNRINVGAVVAALGGREVMWMDRATRNRNIAELRESATF